MVTRHGFYCGCSWPQGPELRHKISNLKTNVIFMFIIVYIREFAEDDLHLSDWCWHPTTRKYIYRPNSVCYKPIFVCSFVLEFIVPLENFSLNYRMLGIIKAVIAESSYLSYFNDRENGINCKRRIILTLFVTILKRLDSIFLKIWP